MTKQEEKIRNLLGAIYSEQSIIDCYTETMKSCDKAHRDSIIIEIAQKLRKHSIQKGIIYSRLADATGWTRGSIQQLVAKEIRDITPYI